VFNPVLRDHIFLMIAELKPDFRSVSLSLELIAAARNFLETPNSRSVCACVCVRFLLTRSGQRCSTRLQLVVVGGSAQHTTHKEESPNGFVLGGGDSLSPDYTQ
jgi:hypothetical protein